jgi:hypothetical protein
MNEYRSYSAKGLKLPDLTSSLNDWLLSESFACQVIQGEGNSTVIQVAKKGGWRKFIGMSTALNIAFRQNEATLWVEIGAGRWVDKATVGAVSLIVLWPLAVTAAYGAWQQMQMPARIFEHISNYVSKPRAFSIHLDPEREKVPAATEKVQVPPGVSITVKRSRTLEHTVSIQWGTTSDISFGMGVKDVWSSTVRNQIEETLGHTFKESETIEYEIELNGNQSKEYTLIWVDTLCKGSVEVLQGNKTELLPFEFREQTELQVKPEG